MSGVRTVLLKDICNFEKGSTGLMKAEPGEYPLVTTGKDRRSCESYQFDTKAVCIPLVSSTGHGHASLNNVHYQEGKFALGTILVALTAKSESELDIQFLHLYLYQLKNTVLVPLMKGAANVSLSITAIKGLEIPLPSINKQRVIVKKFKSIVQEENELLSELSYQNGIVKKIRQSILQDAVEGHLSKSWREKEEGGSVPCLLEKILVQKEKLEALGDIRKNKPQEIISEKEVPYQLPISWKWVRFQDITTVITCGMASTPDYKESGKIFLSAKNVKPYKFMPQVHKFVDEETYSRIVKNSKPEIRDILLTRVGAGIGEAALIDTDIEFAFYVSLTLIKFPHEFVNSKYVLHFLNSNAGIKNAISYTTGKGSSQGNLNVNSVRGFLIPFPPIEEQAVIAEKVEVLLQFCDELEDGINNNKGVAEILMQAVLKEEFSAGS